MKHIPEAVFKLLSLTLQSDTLPAVFSLSERVSVRNRAVSQPVGAGDSTVGSCAVWWVFFFVPSLWL